MDEFWIADDLSVDRDREVEIYSTTAPGVRTDSTVRLCVAPMLRPRTGEGLREVYLQTNGGPATISQEGNRFGGSVRESAEALGISQAEMIALIHEVMPDADLHAAEDERG